MRKFFKETTTLRCHRCEECSEIFECHLCSSKYTHTLHRTEGYDEYGPHTRGRVSRIGPETPVYVCEDCIPKGYAYIYTERAVYDYSTGRKVMTGWFARRWEWHGQLPAAKTPRKRRTA